MCSIPKSPDESQGLEIEFGGLLGAHQHDSAGSIVQLGRVGCCDGSHLLESRFEGGNLVEVNFLVLFVLLNYGGRSLRSRDSNRNDFILKKSRLDPKTNKETRRKKRCLF